MSFPAKTVIDAVRLRILDTESAEYADAELIEYLNRAVDYVVQVAVLAGGRALEKVVDIETGNASAPLPDDYLSLVAVHDADSGEPLKPAGTGMVGESEYRITGAEITAGVAAARLTYTASPPFVTALTDTVELPGATRPLVTELTVFAAKNRNLVDADMEARMSAVFEARLAALLAPGGSGMVRAMPFSV